MRFVFQHSYYDNCDTWEVEIPFEAESMDETEYALLEVQEYNANHEWDDRKKFCGLPAQFDDEYFNCSIVTLEDWFTRGKREMLE